MIKFDSFAEGVGKALVLLEEPFNLAGTLETNVKI